MRHAPILLCLWMLAGQLSGLLHIYDLQVHTGHAECELCVKYSSTEDGATAIAVAPVPVRRTFTLAVIARDDIATPRGSAHAIRAPPRF